MVYLDKHGYKREGFTLHSNLTHRQVAYREIYLKDRGSYPLPFGAYQVHHIDGDKSNDHPSNLMIVTKEQHESIHGRTFTNNEGFPGSLIVIIVVIIIWLYLLFAQHYL